MTASPPDSRRAYWLKTLHEWHWVSSALCLLGMLLFAITGFTLNHAADIEAKPRVTQAEQAVPAPVLDALRQAQKALPAGDGTRRSAVPPELAQWLQSTWQVSSNGRRSSNCRWGPSRPGPASRPERGRPPGPARAL